MTGLKSLIALAREESLLGAYAGSRLAELTLKLADELEHEECKDKPEVALLRGPHGLEAHPAIGKG